MPNATIDTAAKTFNLKTLPGGTIQLKRMTYGEWLHRRDMSMLIGFGQSDSQSVDGSMKLQNEAVTLFEFTKCVVTGGHNLEDAEGEALDFTNPTIMDVLDPRIGNEISGYIESMHDWENDLKN